jgi:hypothetical protein
MNDANTPQAKQGAALTQLLATKSGGLFSRYGLWLAGALIVIAVAAWLFFRAGEDAAAPRYTTEAAALGTLVVRFPPPAICSRPTRWMSAANSRDLTRSMSTTTIR